MANQRQHDFDLCQRVFVYGTLKPGGIYWRKMCDGRTTSVGEARVAGALYDLPLGYPAASFRGSGWILGYVLGLPSVDLLGEMDDLEGYDPDGDPVRNEYTRKRVRTVLPDGTAFGEAWGYEMDRERIRDRGGILCPDGHWTRLFP